MSVIEKLVKKLQEEFQDDVFDEIYHHLEIPLYRHLLTLLKKEEVAQELLQETFLKMIDKIHFYKCPDGSTGFKTWLFRLATNLAFDHLRKEKRQQKMISDTMNVEINNQDNPEKELLQDEERNIFVEGVRQLKKEDRLFLGLKLKENFSYLEISRIFGLSENSVKQRFFRAKMNLRKFVLSSEENV